MSATISPADQCFEEGVEARSVGKPLTDNPYCIRTDEHREWHSGWHATLDLDEDADPDSMRGSDGIRLVDE